MLKTLILASAATALVAAPASARDHRWARHRNNSGDVIAGAVLGAVAGAVIANSANRGYGSYGYGSSYGYGNPAYGSGYGYPAYGSGYGYPAYGSGYGYPVYSGYGNAYPGYGNAYPGYGSTYPGYAYSGYGYPRSGVSISIGSYGGTRYRHHRRYRGW